MGISYRKLFVLLDRKGLKKYDLRQRGIHAAVMDKLVKNRNVDMSTIEKLCSLLNCDIGDIVEYIPEDEQKDGEQI